MSKFTRFLGGPNGLKIRGRRTKTDFKDQALYHTWMVDVSCFIPFNVPNFHSNSMRSRGKYMQTSKVYLLTLWRPKYKRRKIILFLPTSCHFWPIANISGEFMWNINIQYVGKLQPPMEPSSYILYLASCKACLYVKLDQGALGMSDPWVTL